MPDFIYAALDRSGQKLTGTLAAKSRQDALRQLDAQKLQPVSVNESGGLTAAAQAKAIAAGPLKMSRGDVVLFTEELASLLESGMRLEPALQIMEKRQAGNNIRAISGTLRNMVREGASLSASLKAASPSFSPLYISMVTAGEASGTLTEILQKLAAYLRSVHEIQAKATEALIYPSFLLGAGLLLIVLFMTHLLPQLKTLLDTGGRSLPWSTQLLVSFGEIMTTYWWCFLLGFAAIALAAWKGVQTPAGRTWWDQTRLKIPLIGPMLIANFVAQFSHTLATLTTNGVPLVHAMSLVQNIVHNTVLRKALGRSAQEVSEGASLSKSLQRTGHFPGLFLDMVAVGEQTGDVSTALHRIARRYEYELASRIKKLIALVQPAIIILLAGFVLLIAASLLSGISETVSSLRIKR
jgi:general secretion pathway protein F/type IV pilus assembly protein PilC